MDSLNGLPGHRFGEPLSAFPGLIGAEGGTPGLASYHFPTGSPHQLPWFAKHAAEVPGVFYLFRAGKFVAFHAVAYSPAGQVALEQEARFLFGPGRELGIRTEWSGEQAWAASTSSYLNASVIRVLEINSWAGEADQAQSEQERLKAENAQ